MFLRVLMRLKKKHTFHKIEKYCTFFQTMQFCFVLELNTPVTQQVKKVLATCIEDPDIYIK